MTQTPRPTRPTTGFHPLAGIAAIALPGLGHFVAGQRRRALYIAGGVLGLFFGGIFVGGIDVIDRDEDGVWFLGQALVGPLAFGVNFVHQNHFKVIDPSTPPHGRRTANPDEGRDPETGRPVPGGTPPNFKSLGKMNELGTLACTLAGMLNLIAVIDAAFPTRRAGAGGQRGGSVAGKSTPPAALSAEAKA